MIKKDVKRHRIMALSYNLVTIFAWSAFLFVVHVNDNKKLTERPLGMIAVGGLSLSLIFTIVQLIRAIRARNVGKPAGN
jgi:hypothetical protein